MYVMTSHREPFQWLFCLLSFAPLDTQLTFTLFAHNAIRSLTCELVEYHFNLHRLCQFYEIVFENYAIVYAICSFQIHLSSLVLAVFLPHKGFECNGGRLVFCMHTMVTPVRPYKCPNRWDAKLMHVWNLRQQRET